MNPDGVQQNSCNAPYASLTVNAIQNSIDSACLRASSEGTDGYPDSNSKGGWVWSRWNSDDQQQRRRFSLLYGIIGAKEFMTHDSEKDKICTATFYVAYSTWDGRILYIDCTILPNRDTSIAFSMYRILADVATQLHCRRLSWQHTSEGTIQFPCHVQPETMHGWLTLHWKKDSMIHFTSQNRYGTAENHDANMTVTGKEPEKRPFREIIQKALLQYSRMPSACDSQKFRRLRLANCNDDINTICRLVQGLAGFEKEPDAVNVSSDHYRIDGALQPSSEQPIFYCILLESLVEADPTNGCPDPPATTESWYSCGMAFFWVGAKLPVKSSLRLEDRLDQGEELFLYLEDLFIEQEYRGNGAGTCLMHALSNVAQSLNCERMVWQALDWNTPALTFYQEKIGAHIVKGLLSTRFANSSLDEFTELAKN